MPDRAIVAEQPECPEEGAKNLILPAVTLGSFGAAAALHLTRSSMLEVLDSDFIRTARAKGLRESGVIRRLALRNALFPVVTVLGLQMASLLSGTIIIETVFAWPGLGRLMIDSMRTADFPVVSAAVVVTTGWLALVNVAVMCPTPSWTHACGPARCEPAMTRGQSSPEAVELAFTRPHRRRLPRGWRSLSVYLLILGVFIFTGIFADLIAPQDPGRDDLLGRLAGPFWQSDGSFAHPLGTDGLGRDTLSRVIHGARLSLIVVATVIPIALVIGVTLGLLSGWRLGLVDKFLMRVVDMQLAFPGILFAVLLASLYGPSLRNVILVLTLWGHKMPIVFEIAR